MFARVPQSGRCPFWSKGNILNQTTMYILLRVNIFSVSTGPLPIHIFHSKGSPWSRKSFFSNAASVGFRPKWTPSRVELPVDTSPCILSIFKNHNGHTKLIWRNGYIVSFQRMTIPRLEEPVDTRPYSCRLKLVFGQNGYRPG